MKKTYLYVVLILTIAAIFRFAFLTSIPPGIHPDAAVNALDAWRAMQSHHHQVFYEANNGREGLFINLVSYSFQLFGPSFWSYKLPGSLIGLLSVLGMFFFAREVSGKRQVGLLASFLMAISFWMVVFDRTGLRAVISVAAVTWTSYFLLKSLRTNRWFDYALAGVWLGIGLNSYLSFRLLPLALAAGWLHSVLYERRARRVSLMVAARRHWKFALTVTVSVILVLPLAKYFVHHPDFFLTRANEVSVFAQPRTLKLLAESTIANLAIFSFFGDLNWRHNFSSLPILDAFQSVMFYTGIVLALILAKRKHTHPTDDQTRQQTNSFYLLFVFFLMIIPAAMTYSPGGIPHSLRLIDAAPAMFVLVATGFWFIYEKSSAAFAEHRRTLRIGLMCILAGLTIHNAILYFGRWGYNARVAQEFSQDYTKLSAYINNQARQGQKIYLILNSSEVDFFTLTTPNCTKVQRYDDQSARAYSPSLIVFTNLQAADEPAISRLTSTGWISDNTSFGAGNHHIVVLHRNAQTAE